MKLGQGAGERLGRRLSCERGFVEREEGGLGGWSSGDGVELGVMLSERFGDFDLCAFENVDEL